MTLRAVPSAQGEIRIGISGWRYRGWRGSFYPADLRQRDELAFASSKFRTIEINGTFYGMQRPSSFAAWADATPDDFIFSLKGPRFITHMLKLTNARKPLANFFASGVLRLGKKIGPILWQLPPNLQFNPEKLQSFFALLPRSTESAAELARRHDSKLRGRAWLRFDRNCKIRHALEVRHASFKTPEFIDLLRQMEIAVVCADSVQWPMFKDITADFGYCRLHGSEVLYTSGYDAPALRGWARTVTDWAAGRAVAGRSNLTAKPVADGRKQDVFVYFDNDAKVCAPFNALSLQDKVGRILSKTSDGRRRAGKNTG